MKTIKILFPIIAIFFLFHNSFAQEKKDSELFKTLKEKDHLLFNVGFNTCDISQFEKIVSENFEFYHDKSGITPSKAEFITSIKTWLCKADYKSVRELLEDSLEVYPLYNNGVLYGAIQTGKHRFYEFEKDNSKQFRSIAKFNHLWKLENGEWRIIRILSYDHQSKDEIKEL